MRYPAVAGSFYPKHEDDLKDEIERSFKSKFGPGFIPTLDPEGPRAIGAAVNPHAGYMYSGPIGPAPSPPGIWWSGRGRFTRLSRWPRRPWAGR